MMPPSTTITILVDNQAGAGLAAEHGFSLWIETEGGPLLFDTGQGPALPANALALGIDLGTAVHLVLSHALDRMDVETIVPCHCTGEGAVRRLAAALGDRVNPGVSGAVYRF